MVKVNSFLPSIVSRSQPSNFMNFLTPLIAILLTLISGSIIFSVLGYDPVYSLYTFFISPISSPKPAIPANAPQIANAKKTKVV